MSGASASGLRPPRPPGDPAPGTARPPAPPAPQRDDPEAAGRGRPAGGARARPGQAPLAGRRPNRTGSIRRVSGREGYWRADLTVGGTPYRATGSSPEAAWGRLQEKVAAAGGRPPGAGRPEEITVADYVRAWLERRRLEIGRGLEARSWGNHERAVNLHLLPAIGHLTLARRVASILNVTFGASLRHNPM